MDLEDLYRGFRILDLPFPALRHVFGYLRYAELRVLRETLAHPVIDMLCDEMQKTFNREIQIRNDFRWTRYGNSSEGDSSHMAPRLGHSIAYLESDNSMYVFGGRATDGWPRRSTEGEVDTENDGANHNRPNENACFCDLWRIDMATMRNHRIVVTSPPYPSPKYNAGMVVYKEELVLFGGHMPKSNRNAPSMGVTPGTLNTNEIHIFDPIYCNWRKLVTMNDGPTLAGHSMTVCGDLLICYGGHHSTDELNTSFWVLDMRRGPFWFNPQLKGVPQTVHRIFDYDMHIALDFPAYEPGSTSLVELKRGTVLLLGELRVTSFTKNYGVVVSFDPDHEPIKESPWTWRKIEVTGKWGATNGPPPAAGAGSIRHKNCAYPQVVFLRNQNVIRLVTVGVPLRTCAVSSTLMASEHEKRQKRMRNFIERVNDAISNELDRRDAAYRYCRDDQTCDETDLTVESDGIRCSIENCYLTRVAVNSCKLLPASQKPRTLEAARIHIWLDKSHPSHLTMDLDEGDKGDMVIAIRRHLHKMHMVHYTIPPQPFIGSPSSANRFLQKSRLVSYTAVIPLPTEWTPDDVTNIEYEQGDAYLRAPPPTMKFALCAGSAEVLLHGGATGSPSGGNGATITGGHTYLMTPTDRGLPSSVPPPISLFGSLRSSSSSSSPTPMDN